MTLRTGDEGVVRLVFRNTGGGAAVIAVTTPTPRRVVAPTSLLVPDLFATHTLKGRATLDGDASLNIRSPEQVKEIEPNEVQRWEWILKPTEPGTKYLSASLQLVFTPRDPGANAQLVTRPRANIDAQPLTIRNIWGVDGPTARWGAGLVSFISGGILLANNAADLWKKIRGGGDQQAPAQPAGQRARRRRGGRRR